MQPFLAEVAHPLSRLANLFPLAIWRQSDAGCEQMQLKQDALGQVKQMLRRALLA